MNAQGDKEIFVALIFYLHLFASCCRDTTGQWIVTTDSASGVSLSTPSHLFQITSISQLEPVSLHSGLLQMIALVCNFLAIIMTAFTTSADPACAKM